MERFKPMVNPYRKKPEDSGAQHLLEGKLNVDSRCFRCECGKPACTGAHKCEHSKKEHGSDTNSQ